MFKLTQSLKKYLENYHKDIIIPLTFGHTELLTQEIWGNILIGVEQMKADNI